MGPLLVLVLTLALFVTAGAKRLIASQIIGTSGKAEKGAASSSALSLRAGARRSSGGPAARRSSSAKRLEEDEDGDEDEERGNDDEDEDEEEDEDERPRKKAKGGSSKGKDRGRGGKGKGKSGRARGGKGKKRRQRNQLVKWGEQYGKASAGLREGLREKIEELAKQGQTAYKDVYRRAKVLRSSAFEAMLLRATWPGDESVPQDLLDEIIKHSIPAFKYGRSSAEDDPYHMTMHKLWTKMCEKDWRTVVKSLFIVHCISRDCSVDACNRFAMAIKDMSRVRNPKNPDHKYFDLSLVKEVDDVSAPYEPFVAAYSAYVLHRAKMFSSKFEELKEISDQTHEKQAVARLRRAQTCITLGLKCGIEDRDQQNLITGHATRVLCNDLRDCWKQFTAKLAPLAGVEGVAPYGGAKAEEKDIVALLQFYRDTGKDIKAFLSKALKSYGPLRIKVPSEIETKFLPPADFEEKLSARAAALTTSVPPPGGATPRKDEDEDDEEDDEEENKEEGEEDEEEDDEEEDDEEEEEEEEEEEKEDEEDEEEKEDEEENDESDADEYP